MSKPSAVEVTIYSDGSVPNLVEAAQKAFAHLDTNGVDVVTTTGDLDDVLREAEAKAADTEGKDLFVICTRDGSHDDRNSATRSFQALADDGNFVLVLSEQAITGDTGDYLTWADDDAPFNANVDVLTVDQLPGTEVAQWAKNVPALA